MTPLTIHLNTAREEQLQQLPSVGASQGATYAAPSGLDEKVDPGGFGFSLHHAMVGSLGGGIEQWTTRGLTD